MKLAYKKVPPLITLILFAYLIWPYLGRDTKANMGKIVTPTARVLPGDPKLVISDKIPARDPFLQAGADGYKKLDLLETVPAAQLKPHVAKASASGAAAGHDKFNNTNNMANIVFPPLAGTIVSGDYCCAYIDGRLYEPGDILEVGGEGSFRIKKITVGHVLLQSDTTGATHEMIPDLEHAMRISPTTPPASPVDNIDVKITGSDSGITQSPSPAPAVERTALP